MQGTSGSPEVETPRFQHRESGWIPVGRTKNPTCLHGMAKTKQKKTGLITAASSNHTFPPPHALIQDMPNFVTGKFSLLLSFKFSPRV